MAEAASAAPVRLVALPPARILRVEAWPDTADEVAGRLAAFAPLPDGPGRFTAGDGVLLVATGLRRHLLIGPPDGPVPDLDPALAGVIDIGPGRTGFLLEGPRAADVLLRGVALDLHANAFPAGGAAETAVARVGALVLRRGGEAFECHVAASLARSFASFVADAAVTFGGAEMVGHPSPSTPLA